MQEVSNSDHELIEEHLKHVDRKLHELAKRVTRRVQGVELARKSFMETSKEADTLNSWLINLKESLSGGEVLSWKSGPVQTKLTEREVSAFLTKGLDQQSTHNMSFILFYFIFSQILLKECELKASTVASLEKQINAMSNDWLLAEKEGVSLLLTEIKALRTQLLDTLKNIIAELTIGVQDRVR